MIPQLSGGHGLIKPWPWNWLSFDSYGWGSLRHVLPKLAIAAVSYTHLDVYKRQDDGWLDDVLEDLRRMDARGYTEMPIDRRL